MMKTMIKNNKKQHSFQVFFLKNNITQDNQEFELQNINFEAIKNHLENGVSVYIKTKKKKDLT